MGLNFKKIIRNILEIIETFTIFFDVLTKILIVTIIWFIMAEHGILEHISQRTIIFWEVVTIGFILRPIIKSFIRLLE